MGTLRLFVAVTPPPTALAEVATAVEGVRALPGADRLRWTDPATWHLALAFYGEVAREAVPDLCERLARGTAGHPPGRLWLAGSGRFSQRVLWLGVAGDRPLLDRLAATASAAGRRAGVARSEHRPYHPHLTLARSRGRGRGREHPDLAPFAARLAGFAGSPWALAEVGLVRSHLPTGEAGAPPRYETVARWTLRD
ncbi:RNA 2',3'-cyclic phosphodiesterase [Streptomyces sp. 4N509B]|uniref:RNA 2',3'-cyclic phosphodiesterase n=1 Tax=Streptomyces sp. 4N509B TaxID=3457413 RepID=UPI003FD1E4D5